jgi:hypothetical protein
MNPPFVCPSGYRERTIEDKIIVSCGIGYGYQAGLSSTRNHCSVYEPDTWQLIYTELPDGCPPHSEQQYAFKIYALDRAIQAGFRYVCWMDATFQPVAPLDAMWARVKEQGWYIPPQMDAKLGSWISDAALSLLGMSRDHAMAVPLVYSGIVALDMSSAVGKVIWHTWKVSCEAGAFNGPHRNQPGPIVQWGNKLAGWCSDDPRCEGHRHDEAVLSTNLHFLGRKPEVTGILELEALGGCIGHHVPDYDVVKMRRYLIDHLQCPGVWDDEAKDVRQLCR